MTQRIRLGMVAAVTVAACRAATFVAAAQLAAVPAMAAAPTGPGAASPASVGGLTVKMRKATPSGPGDALGTIGITASDAGAEFKPKLRGLPPGRHGFHVHEDTECGPIFMNGVRIPAGAAGGHWDPEHSGKHAGPMGNGHLGDLPLIDVGTDGTAAQTLTAPRIKDIQPLKGRALVIDAGGDTYSDDPSSQGGGGLRIACGSIE